jgi:hypothetical protein
MVAMEAGMAQDTVDTAHLTEDTEEDMEVHTAD